MKKFLICCLFLHLASSSLHAKADSFFFGQEEKLHLVVNNRILAKVNGKAISVIDVMKKMDMLFYRQFPEYTSSVQARFQFYQVNWKHVLQELIDKELILADAEEVKLPISPGDVRQEMESLFGPNIITNLDKVGLTYDESLKMVQGDITIRRMVYLRANSKALKKVTPQVVRTAYEEFAKNNIRPEQWQYYVISVRDPDATSGAEIANRIYQLLEEKTPPTELLAKLKTEMTLDKKTSVNVSEEFHHTEKELSEAYKEILTKLESGAHSRPIPQKSRTDKSTVFRIFFLKELKAGGPIPFSEVENELKDKLLDEASAKESEAYLKRLRLHFDVQDNHLKEMIEAEFQPFELR